MNQLKRHHEYVQHDLEMTLFFELIFGEETEFYQTLLNEDLIDRNFDINLYSNLHIVFNYYKCNAISR